MDCHYMPQLSPLYHSCCKYTLQRLYLSTLHIPWLGSHHEVSCPVWRNTLYLYATLVISYGYVEEQKEAVIELPIGFEPSAVQGGCDERSPPWGLLVHFLSCKS